MTVMNLWTARGLRGSGLAAGQRRTCSCAPLAAVPNRPGGRSKDPVMEGLKDVAAYLAPTVAALSGAHLMTCQCAQSLTLHTCFHRGARCVAHPRAHLRQR
jgi:hypothetical protein